MDRYSDDVWRRLDFTLADFHLNVVPQVDILKDEGEAFGFSHSHGKVQFNRARGAHGTGEGFWAPRGTAAGCWTFGVNPMETRDKSTV